VQKIILIDDDDSFRKMLCITLKQMNYEVFESRNGIEAIRKFIPELPDVLITDIIMPGKLGIEIIGAFRTRHPTIKVIAMSGAGRIVKTEYLKMALAAGADAVLDKPFTTGALATILKRLLASEPDLNRTHAEQA
jgi:YesN/AraC family two-component response regulator